MSSRTSRRAKTEQLSTVWSLISDMNERLLIRATSHAARPAGEFIKRRQIPDAATVGSGKRSDDRPYNAQTLRGADRGEHWTFSPSFGSGLWPTRCPYYLSLSWSGSTPSPRNGRLAPLCPSHPRYHATWRLPHRTMSATRPFCVFLCVYPHPRFVKRPDLESSFSQTNNIRTNTGRITLSDRL